MFWWKQTISSKLRHNDFAKLIKILYWDYTEDYENKGNPLWPMSSLQIGPMVWPMDMSEQSSARTFRFTNTRDVQCIHRSQHEVTRLVTSWSQLAACFIPWICDNYFRTVEKLLHSTSNFVCALWSKCGTVDPKVSCKFCPVRGHGHGPWKNGWV